MSTYLPLAKTSGLASKLLGPVSKAERTAGQASMGLSLLRALQGKSTTYMQSALASAAGAAAGARPKDRVQAALRAAAGDFGGALGAAQVRKAVYDKPSILGDLAETLAAGRIASRSVRGVDTAANAARSRKKGLLAGGLVLGSGAGLAAAHAGMSLTDEQKKDLLSKVKRAQKGESVPDLKYFGNDKFGIGLQKKAARLALPNQAAERLVALLKRRLGGASYGAGSKRAVVKRVRLGSDKGQSVSEVLGMYRK